MNIFLYINKYIEYYIVSLYIYIYIYIKKYIRHRACAYGVLKALAVRPLHSYLLHIPTYLTTLKGPEIRRRLKPHPLPGHLPDLLKPHQNPSKTSCNLPRPLWSRHRASCSRPKLSGLSSRGPSGARTLARAETGRPQNWSPASSGSTIIIKSSQDLFES